ncbi:MAG: glutathione synthase [Polyangiaceae bacterium]
MKLLFVMDGLDRVHPEKDTTFGFVQSAALLGHECEHCLIHQVERIGGTVTAWARSLRYEAAPAGTEGPGRIWLEGAPRRLDLARDVDAVFIRKDPPFDSPYHHATLILEHLRGQTLVVNDPRGLREANEKLYALHFADWMPKTIVTSERQAILDFVREVGGRAVIKPLDGAGGYGVLGLKAGDGNEKAIIDLLTKEGRELAEVQEFLPDVKDGDKRVLLLDGEPLGAILRVPPEGDHRANIHIGGSVVPTELDEQELRLVAAVGPRLRQDGLYFVGLDLIGGKLTEVNVTSPTGIRELSTHRGERISDRVIRWTESKVG